MTDNPDQDRPGPPPEDRPPAAPTPPSDPAAPGFSSDPTAPGPPPPPPAPPLSGQPFGAAPEFPGGPMPPPPAGPGPVPPAGPGPVPPAGWPPPGPPPAYGAGAPPGGYGAPAGYGTGDEKTWNLISHFGGAAGVLLVCGVLGWVAPLVSLMAKGNQNPNVRAHALEALNFQITWAVAVIVSSVAICTGFLAFVPFLVAIVPIVFGVIAGVKASNGEFYRYPLSVRLVK